MKARLPSIVRLINKRSYANFNVEQMPGPPKLPKKQQEEFERLQKIASSQAAIDDYNRKIEGNGVSQNTNQDKELKTDIGGFSSNFLKTIPEFQGDVNPKTGEKGGPKQDPLRHNDWSYNGRVTDF